MKNLVCNKRNLMAVFASLFLLNVQLALANFPRERDGDGDLPVFDFSKYECPHVTKLAKFKLPNCPTGMFWNTLCKI